jgi:glycosyltransferase involved in cell wall biosynthesis
MRISFDMQALQSVNRAGGIGRYCRDFLRTLFALYPNNEYLLVYNGRCTEGTTEQFEGRRVHSHSVRYLPGNDLNPLNRWIQLADVRLRAADILHILSPFEEQRHCVIPNKRLSSRIVITAYDFIPYIFKELYLGSAESRRLYAERLRILQAADLILTISEATKRDAVDLFGVSSGKIVNIGLAVSEDYQKFSDSEYQRIRSVREKYGITGDFVLTVSNLDHRKNMLALLQAFSSLPPTILKQYSLVVVTNSGPQYISANKAIGDLVGGNPKARIKFLYTASNRDLSALYNCCKVFVYASLYEGGGLPVLEAMRCGAPVVASDCSSIPEHVGRKDNLFNPCDVGDIARSMLNALTDDTFRTDIAEHGLKFSQGFTWQRTAERAMKAYSDLLNV